MLLQLWCHFQPTASILSRAGDILLLFILVPTAALMAWTGAVCTPRSPSHINNISYNRLLPEVPTEVLRLWKWSHHLAAVSHSSFWVHALYLASLPLLPWQPKAALWHRDKKFTGLQLFLLRAKSNPFHIFLLSGKLEPEQLTSNFNIHYRKQKALTFLEYYLHCFSDWTTGRSFNWSQTSSGWNVLIK